MSLTASTSEIELVKFINTLDGNYMLRDMLMLEGSPEANPTYEKFGLFKQQAKVKVSNKTTAKPNSAFVSKIVANEQLAKILSQKTSETFYVFFNVGKALVWADYFWKLQNPLSVLYMKDAIVTCHDVNLVIRDTMTAIIGFNSGDILCFSPISGKYNRLNRAGAIHKYPVTCIKWLPGSETLFIAGFEDGSLMIFDRDFDDQNTPITATPEDYLLRQAPKGSKNNPRTYWKISRKSVTSISFSPDFQHFAVTSMDGTMKVVHYETGKRTDIYKSFFGGFLCCTWSPDGRFIVAGSQDDLLSIFAFKGRLLVRMQGHTSWPTSVSFDEWRCTEKYFRLGSVGEDTRVCLWDFSLSSLRRPKALSMARSKSYNEIARTEGPVFHHTPAKQAVPIIEPITSKALGGSPLCAIVFREDGFVTADKTGRLSVWERPAAALE
ncbi:hypothetical protein HDU91_000067 [Kappamyces sp. JEL0680]|nr:hypothetical protein HDU91_000067 [Kappamyces sp. JEL0680]